MPAIFFGVKLFWHGIDLCWRQRCTAVRVAFFLSPLVLLILTGHLQELDTFSIDGNNIIFDWAIDGAHCLVRCY